MEGLSRREFLGAAARLLFAGVVITVTGCSSEDGTGPGAGVTDKDGVIEGNHGHVAMITAAQLNAGGALTLHIEGSAGHDHTVSLTSGEMTAIKAGTQVAKESSENGHSHMVTFN